MEEEVKEKQNNVQEGNYTSGIIGAILGGILTTIPWVLVYVYGNMMLSILAVLIAAGEFYGYKLFKGKMSKGVPAILMILAIIIVTIATLVIIPALIIQQKGLPVSINHIMELYKDSKFSSAMVHDYMISIVFTILGASVITSNLKKQIANSDGKEVKLDLNNTEQTNERKKLAIELIKPIFTKYEAVNKEKAMLKEEVLADTEDVMAKQQFTFLKQLGIIKKYKGKYYYSEENETKQMKPKKFSTLGIIGVIVLVVAIIVTIVLTTSNIFISKQKITDNVVEFEIGKKWEKEESQYEKEWNFYRYINTFPSSDENAIEEDYSSYPAVINIFYDKIDTTMVRSPEDIKKSLEATFDAAQEDARPDEFNIDIGKTDKNYDMVKVRMKYSKEPEGILYYYYILKEDTLVCITSSSYCLDDEKEIEKQSESLINSFDWV